MGLLKSVKPPAQRGRYNFSLQRHFYHLQHEQVLLCTRPDADQREIWLGDRKQISVWNVSNVARGQRIHPTEKPVGVYAIPIANHTDLGDEVIDPFAGSGVIFEACQDSGRIGLGVELCPLVCQRILERMAHLGLKPELDRNLFGPKPKRRKAV